MLVFTGTDRLSHFLWDAYEEPNHKYHAAFLDHFKKIDGIVGEISLGMEDGDCLIMLSDHGFESLDRQVNINYLLQEKGFLRLREGSKKNFSDIDYGTKAFALDPARIYVNRKEKYPHGSVSTEDAGEVINELIDLFDSLETNGRKVITRIYRRDEIYRGPFLNRAPELVLAGNSGFNLKANMKANNLLEKDIFTGKHTQQDAFLLVKDMFGEA